VWTVAERFKGPWIPFSGWWLQILDVIHETKELKIRRNGGHERMRFIGCGMYLDYASVHDNDGKE
jgi:hypothetical protein